MAEHHDPLVIVATARLRGPPPRRRSLVRRQLLDSHRWQSHGQMISWSDAVHESIGLAVEYLEPESELWQRYWQLYTYQRLAIKDEQKLFESEFASLVI